MDQNENKTPFHFDPSLFLNGDPVPVVKEHKFFGLIFDNKLNFIPHIQYLKAKCKKNHLIYSRSFHIMTGADHEALFFPFTRLLYCINTK